MNEYTLLKALSELDERLIIKPKKHVSLRLNMLFCFLAANISAFVPKRLMLLGVAVFFAAFYIMYITAYLIMNRGRKKQLLIDGDKKLSEASGKINSNDIDEQDGRK